MQASYQLSVIAMYIKSLMNLETIYTYMPRFKTPFLSGFQEPWQQINNNSFQCRIYTNEKAAETLTWFWSQKGYWVRETI